MARGQSEAWRFKDLIVQIRRNLNFKDEIFLPQGRWRDFFRSQKMKGIPYLILYFENISDDYELTNSIN